MNHFKKLISLFLIIVLIAMSTIASVVAADLTATPTASIVTVNGEQKNFDAYNINDNNYFKLRDLAFVLNNTEKQFEVTWDGSKNAITMLSKKPYTVAGGEMKAGTGGTKTPVQTKSKIYADDKEIELTAYNIDGNNYFKLRDIAKIFDFNVTWDGTIVINTTESYSDSNTDSNTDDNESEPESASATTKSELDAAVNAIIAEVITDGMNDFEKELAIFDWMTVNVFYDYPNMYKPGSHHSAYGALVNQVAVCDGYSYGFKMLMDKLEIPCKVNLTEGADHAFNTVELDGETYRVDATWGSSTTDYAGAVKGYTFFNYPVEGWKKWQEKTNHPPAKYNYFDYYIELTKEKLKEYPIPVVNTIQEANKIVETEKNYVFINEDEYKKMTDADYYKSEFIRRAGIDIGPSWALPKEHLAFLEKAQKYGIKIYRLNFDTLNECEKYHNYDWPNDVDNPEDCNSDVVLMPDAPANVASFVKFYTLASENAKKIANNTSVEDFFYVRAAVEGGYFFDMGYRADTIPSVNDRKQGENMRIKWLEHRETTYAERLDEVFSIVRKYADIPIEQQIEKAFNEELRRIMAIY